MQMIRSGRVASLGWQQRVMLFSSKATSSSSHGNPDPPALFPEQLNIIYDSKCSICKLEMDFLARRDAKLSGSLGPKKIRLTDIESDSYDADDPVNGGVTYERGMAAIHAVTSDGRVIEGPSVFSKAYALVELGWLFKFTEWRIMKPFVQWGYEVFANYRTIVTRGETLEDLYAAKKKKKKKKNMLYQNGKDEECDMCNNIKR